MRHQTSSAPKLPRPPRWMIYTLIVLVVASWIPLGLIAVARSSRSPKPRVHIFQDMDVQPRYNAQDATPLFEDNRAMRLPVAGTIARGELAENDFLHRGYATDPATGEIIPGENGQPKQYFQGYPPEVEVNRALLERGRERYNIYCAVCHGDAGYGDGPVHRRVELIRGAALANAQPDPAQPWVQPRNLHDARLRQMQPAYFFDIITNGIGKMSPYASQVDVMDRWAIVAYIQALQLSQNYPADQLPEGETPKQLPEGVTVPSPAPAAPAPANGAEQADMAPAPATEGAADAELVAQGKQLFQTLTCFACHASPDFPATPPLAPSFVDGLVGNTETVTVGVGGPTEEVVVDKEYFVESVKNPMARIVVNEQTGQPYQPIMVLPVPPTDAQIEALWAYVKSISNK